MYKMSSIACLAILILVTVFQVSGNSLTPTHKDWLQDQRSHIGVKAEDTFVKIRNGTLKGTTYIALGGGTIYAYLGIPYAKAPVGDLRFQPPQPFEDAWGDEEPRNANLHPAACPQWLTNTTVAREDCLFVSVYTKRTPDELDNPLPVMYWVHGGGFLLGQTSYYTASKLLQNDVVLVTVQYRMGPLGFISTLDDVFPGNYGMHDQVQGLKWVQENIAAFGGNPQQVTVFGESAGAASATFMLISPAARGLFHGVAAMSGTAIAEWSLDRDPIGSTNKLANALNCPNATSTEIKNCLMSKPWEEISQKHFEMMLGTQAGELRANLAGTSPVIEHDHPGAFISKEPLELLEHGEIAQVPVMMGANQHEGSFLLAAAYILRLAHNNTLGDETYVHDKLIGDLLATWGVDESVNGASISQVLASGFIPHDNPRTNFTTFTYELIDMFSALFMKAPILRTVEILSRRVPAVYLYSFEYASRTGSLWNFLPLIPLIIPELEFLVPPFDGGITHADDLIYMFSFPLIPSPTDRLMNTIYPTYFTNFATHGTPDETWTKFSINDPYYMRILPTPELLKNYPASWRQGLTNEWEE